MILQYIKPASLSPAESPGDVQALTGQHGKQSKLTTCAAEACTCTVSFKGIWLPVS